MKWIFTDEFINMNNVNKLTFDTHWSPERVDCTPVLCVDMYMNVNGESYRYIYKCSYNKFNVHKLENKFYDFINSNLAHVFDFYQKCRDIEADEDIDNR